MIEVHGICLRLTQAVQSLRAAIRSLGGGRESQDSSQKGIMVMSEISDLIHQLKDHIIWAEEKWIVTQPRLHTLDDLLSSLNTTIASLEMSLQSGAVNSRTYKKGILDNTFIPRFEHYKVAFIVAMQPDSCERTATEQNLKSYIRACRELDSSRNTPVLNEHGYHNITRPITSKNVIRLTEMCSRREKGTAQWIFEEERYKDWLFGSFRTLYCVGPAGAGKTFLA
ncbi:NACHT and Ankyrin domain protein [Aspergillus homomorphus CBS 101889]|uniref:Nephrocystin 3-like N-terminal domain-containing protein n=1 Tax=Aspergillus homomorphus (strain CBS 101889) TaxID=1450537 RepID=A0A395HYR4_ASPHC|nr:hypothetical protein BO97DRAFT_103399 [Aspergillus homomorphus CBS 101889]RAL11394.1 hypothetical protein BO97DRAFT_103399 [Aspergillus homomorphus CBS 101889]